VAATHQDLWIFIRLPNPDGSFESTCPVCFETAGRKDEEEDLARDEHTHVCDPDNLAKLAIFLEFGAGVSPKRPPGGSADKEARAKIMLGLPGISPKCADHSGCRQLHERVVRSTEILENLIFLMEQETDDEKLEVYLEFAKRELIKLRISTNNFRVFIGERHRRKMRAQAGIKL